MTVPSAGNIVELTGTDSTATQYAIPWHFTNDTDLQVWLRDATTGALTPQVLDTNFSVFNADTPPTGSVGA